MTFTPRERDDYETVPRKLGETVQRRMVLRRALLSSSFGVSVGIEERTRVCPFTDRLRRRPRGEKERERKKVVRERESENARGEKEREGTDDGSERASETRAQSITNTAHGISESDSAAHATARGQVPDAEWRCPPERSAPRKGGSSTRLR